MKTRPPGGGRNGFNQGRHAVKRVLLASGLMFAVQPALALEPDVNLSGTFATSLSYYRNDSNVSEIEDVDLENNGSNFRITAAAQDVGIRAFMAYERGASNDQLGVEDVREFYAGVSGTLGTVMYGRKATDYRIAGEKLDPFYNTSVAGFNGQFAAEGASYGLSNLTNGYTSNTIAYRSPLFYGVNFNLAGYVNDNNNQGAGEETDFAAGVGYTNSDWLGLDVGVQALDINGNVVTGSPAGESTAWRLHANVAQKLWAVGLSYEMVDVDSEADPRLYGFLSGSYQVLEDLRLALTIGSVSDTPSFDGAGGTLGAFYELTKNLSTYVAARHVALDNGNEDKTTTVAGGIKFIFDVDL